MERNKNNEEPDKIWGSVSCTVNLGNYENIKIDLGYSRSLKENENPSKIREEILDDLIEEIIERKTQLK